LEKRRLRSDLIETFKFMKGMSREIFLNWMTGRRGHDQKLFKKGFRLDVRKFAFSNRVVRDWNSLSSSVLVALQ